MNWLQFVLVPKYLQTTIFFIFGWFSNQQVIPMLVSESKQFYLRDWLTVITHLYGVCLVLATLHWYDSGNHLSTQATAKNQIRVFLKMFPSSSSHPSSYTLQERSWLQRRFRRQRRCTESTSRMMFLMRRVGTTFWR